MNVMKAIPALIVGLGGVSFAKIGFSEGWWVSFVIFLLPVILAWPLEWYARNALLPKQPELAAWIMELWILIPLCFATAGAGATIGVAVAFAERDTWTAQEKQLFSAIATGLTAFIAASLVKSAEDPNEWLSTRAKRAFQRVYKGDRPDLTPEKGIIYFLREPNGREGDGELWAHADPVHGVSGWSFFARHKRAQGISSALKTGQYRPAS